MWWDFEEIGKIQFGPLVHCKGGGGGGGGAGIVDYPAYMKTFHENVLGDGAVTDDITAVMDAAIGSSPYAAMTAYDPDAALTSLVAAPGTLQTLVNLLSAGTTLDTLISDILDPTRIDDVVDEYAADFDARLTAETLPRFEAGMRNINAVVSSAFVLGRALIEENQDRQVAKFSADLHLKGASDDALKVIQLKLEYQKSASQMIAEAYRIKIVAKKEEADINNEIDGKDALWDLEVFQFGANMLAAIGGGTAVNKGVSSTASMIGGAMSGAAAGAMVGGAPGAVVGGVLGAAAGLLS